MRVSLKLTVLFLVAWSVRSPAPDIDEYRTSLHTILTGTEASEAQRVAAIAQLARERMANRDSVEILTQILFPGASSLIPPQAAVAEEAMRTVSRISQVNPTLISQRAAIAMCLRKAGDAQPWVRASSAEALQILGFENQAVREATVQIVESRNPPYAEEARFRAIELLWLDGGAWTRPVLRAALTDENLRVRLRACEALVALGFRADAAPTLQQMRRGRVNPQLRERIDAALSETRPTSPSHVPFAATCQALIRIASGS